MNSKTTLPSNSQVELEVIKNKLEIAQQLVTHDKFYRYWFEQLGKPENRHKTKTEVFHQVNDLYIKIFNTKKGRYSSYRSFMNTVTKARKAY